MLNRILQKFGLPVLSISEVEDSHSSTVYKCNLHNGENVFLKIPYTKLKYRGLCLLGVLAAYNLVQ